MNAQLPVPSSSLSHWHRTTRSFPHLNANFQVEIPSSIRYLIIGSGITGALTAWKLLESGIKGSDILILEAREAASGATGRNAGHVRPDAFRGFSKFRALHGPEQAKKIIENERTVLENVRQFVVSNNIDCDFRHTTTVEVCMTPEYAALQAESLKAFKDAGGDISHIKCYNDREVGETTGIAEAAAAYEWPAASNHPGKLTQWILSDVIAKGGRLWTHCPATKIVKYVSKSKENTGLRWKVQTPRGAIFAETVVHCTNAYAGLLRPELAGIVVPRVGQIHAFVPTYRFSGENFAQRTMSLRYGSHNYFSFNQLKDGTILLGGSGTKNEEDLTPERAKGLMHFNDTSYDDVTVANSNREFTKLSFASGPPSATLRPGEGLSYVWTGVIGSTPDSVPFVGPLEGLDGQWICAGFDGYGMARIFTCAPGLVKLMAGEPWEATDLPECFRFSQERLNKMTRKVKSQL